MIAILSYLWVTRKKVQQLLNLNKCIFTSRVWLEVSPLIGAISILPILIYNNKNIVLRAI